MIVPAFIFLLVLVLYTGCARTNPQVYIAIPEHPDPIFIRTLSEKEMSLPFSGYNRDLIEARIVQLDFPSPKEKPKVEWTRKYYAPRDFHDITVDSEGCAWLICWADQRWLFKSDDEYEKFQKNEPVPYRTLVRLNPDNSISWKRDIYGYSPEYPTAIVCDGTVIWYLKTNFNPRDKLNIGDIIGLPCEVSFECISNDGKTVWRTQSSMQGVMQSFEGMVWRISGNRIMTPTERDHSGRFNIFSVSDGTLIETMKFPAWKTNENGSVLQPIELPGKGWIGYQKDNIVLFNPDLRPIWKCKAALSELRSPPVVLKDNLIFSTNDNITALNLDTGEIVWQKDEYNYTDIHATDSVNNYIFFTSSFQNKPGRFYAINDNGDLIFSSTYQIQRFHFYNKYNHTITFNDGCVLYNDKDNLNLIDREGSQLWKLSLVDLGFTPNIYTIDDTLSYATDGRLLINVKCNNFEFDKYSYLISFQIGE